MRQEVPVAFPRRAFVGIPSLALRRLMNDLNWSQTSDTGAAGCLATRQDATISFGIFVQQSRNSVLSKIFFFLPAQSGPYNSLRLCIIKNDASVLSLASSMGMKKRAEILLVNHIPVLMCSVFYNKFQLSFLSQTSVQGRGKNPLVGEASLTKMLLYQMPFEPFLSCCLEMWDPARSRGVTPCCIMRKWNATWHMGSGRCLPGVGAAWHVLQPVCLEMSARLLLQKKLVAYLILYEEITDIALKGQKEDRTVAVMYTQDTSTGSTYLLSTFTEFIYAESCFYFSVYWHLCVPLAPLCPFVSPPQHLSCGVHLVRGAFQLSHPHLLPFGWDYRETAQTRFLLGESKSE